MMVLKTLAAFQSLFRMGKDGSKAGTGHVAQGVSLAIFIAERDFLCPKRASFSTSDFHDDYLETTGP